MNNRTIERCEYLAEEHLLQALAWSNVLPYAELKTRAAASLDDVTFRRVLDDLIARGLVRRKGARQGMWYIGYTQARPAVHHVDLDDMPAPFRKLLSELAW